MSANCPPNNNTTQNYKEQFDIVQLTGECFDLKYRQ